MNTDRFAESLGLKYHYFDLSTARTKEVVSMPDRGADGFFCDYRTTGEAELFLGDPSSYGFPIKKQSGMGVEFNRLFLSNTAQAGKVLHLWYGRGFHFLQPNLDIASIGTIDLVSAITPPPVRATPYFRLSSSAALNTIVTPAANTAGVRVSRGYISSSNQVRARLMMKQTAPTSWNDSAAVTLAMADSAAGVQFPLMWDNEFIVPAGWGLYEQGEGAGNFTSVSFGYEVLS